MSQCSPEDKNEIQMKLNQITTNFADVEEMAKLRLEELNKERMKAEDYEKQAAGLDDWLKDKEAMVEQWEEFAIDSATLEQQMEKIGVTEYVLLLELLYLLIIVVVPLLVSLIELSVCISTSGCLS